jgi:hypothetical protein
MHRVLGEDKIPEYYSFLNNAQKNATQIDNKTIDLFILLDISGSMNSTSNKILNFGAGTLGFIGQIFGFDKLTLTQMFNTRLDESKRHLVCQIRSLIQEGRINKLGLITFNNSARVNYELTSDF